MTEQRAKRILGNAIIKIGITWIGQDSRMVVWHKKDSTVYLAGRFLPLELEAVAWWVGHKQKRA